MDSAIKEILSSIPAFLKEFLNLLLSPRAYASSGRVFEPTRFNDSLGFLAVSLVVTLVLKAPMFSTELSALPYLAADAFWKFFIVLIETVLIQFAWRLAKGKGTISHYLVANFFYFGVFTVFGHTIKLLGHEFKIYVEALANSNLLVFLFYAITGFPLFVWMIACWFAYVDFNNVKFKQSALVLILVGALSAVTYFLAKLMRDALFEGVFIA